MSISAYDFAADVAHGFMFGTAESASALRALADRIEAQEVFVQKVHVSSIARGDEFTETVLVLRFEEKK